MVFHFRRQLKIVPDLDEMSHHGTQQFNQQGLQHLSGLLHEHDLWTSVAEELSMNPGSDHCLQESWQTLANGHWRWCEVLIHWRNLRNHDRRWRVVLHY